MRWMTSTKTRSRSLRVATTLLAFLAPPKTLTRSCCTREVPLLANKLVENLDGVKAPHDDTAETSRMVENFIEEGASETSARGRLGTWSLGARFEVLLL